MKNNLKLPFPASNPYQQIIVKHAKQKAKNGRFDWEKMGKEIYALISKNQEGINKYGTQAERKKYDEVMNDGEEVLNFFFSESSFGAPMYDWVNGNSDFQRLVKQIKGE